MSVVVREARVDDLAAVALVRARSWAAAYAGIVPPAYLDQMQDEEALERSRRSWETRPADRFLLVAEVGGQVVGFASGGPERPNAAGIEGRGEVYAIYTLPEVWSTGVGAALMAGALARLTRYQQVVLWVLEENKRARAFYERVGWGWTGAREELQLGGVTLQELQYQRPGRAV
ncbi:GNAT family N-acetyltransferase [Streptacidiphilus monticola]|uniref:GNAT family N-acetyltransferase n=1 Tax=Streptacidiphilus monticola TaxID=2161674 RepID=A0ABW1G1J5_9ACTN